MLADLFSMGREPWQSIERDTCIRSVNICKYLASVGMFIQTCIIYIYVHMHMPMYLRVCIYICVYMYIHLHIS